MYTSQYVYVYVYVFICVCVWVCVMWKLIVFVVNCPCDRSNSKRVNGNMKRTKNWYANSVWNKVYFINDNGFICCFRNPSSMSKNIKETSKSLSILSFVKQEGKPQQEVPILLRRERHNFKSTHCNTFV